MAQSKFPSPPDALSPVVQPLPIPQLSDARVALTRGVLVRNEFGQTQEVHIPAERPLTLYLDKQELVTLMTVGAAP
ncbi:MAG: sulfurtransferase FdhD, partial [Thiomonas sp.]